MDHHEDMESYLAVIQSHPECAFLWFLSDTPLTEKQQKLLLSCPNLMVSLPIDAPSTASMAKALRDVYKRQLYHLPFRPKQHKCKRAHFSDFVNASMQPHDFADVCS